MMLKGCLILKEILELEVVLYFKQTALNGICSLSTCHSSLELNFLYH